MGLFEWLLVVSFVFSLVCLIVLGMVLDEMKHIKSQNNEILKLLRRTEEE